MLSNKVKFSFFILTFFISFVNLDLFHSQNIPCNNYRNYPSHNGRGKKTRLSIRKSRMTAVLLFIYKSLKSRKLYRDNQNFGCGVKLGIGGIGRSDSEVFVLGVNSVREGCADARKRYACVLHK